MIRTTFQFNAKLNEKTAETKEQYEQQMKEMKETLEKQIESLKQELATIYVGGAKRPVAEEAGGHPGSIHRIAEPAVTKEEMGDE